MTKSTRTVMLLSVLGDFTRYSPVFYRVYVPRERSREPVIIASNLGPLSVAIANLYKLREENTDLVLKYILLAPLTLVSILSHNHEEITSLIDNPERLINKLVNNLIKNINEKYELINQWINTRLTQIPRDNRQSGDSIEEIEILAYRVAGDLNTKTLYNNYDIPSVAIYPKTLNVDIYKISSKGIDKSSFNVKLILGVGLVPLTGSFSVDKGKLKLLFREEKRIYIEKFRGSLYTSYLQTIYSILRLFHRERDLGDDGIDRLIIDTTHGVNESTVIMTHVIHHILPLLYYELIRPSEESGKYRVLIYNSDPAIGIGKDADALNNTYGFNISYYYQLIESTPKLSTIMSMIEQIIERICIDYKNRELDKRNKVFIRGVIGLYLLYLGLIPWGLYHIDQITSEERDVLESLLMSNIITYKIDKKDGKDRECVEKSCKKHVLEIIYRIKSDEQLHQGYERYIEAIGLWLILLLKKYLNELYNRIQGLIMKPINCWTESTSITRIQCYSLKELKSLVMADKKNELLYNIISTTGRSIFEYEVDNWFKDPFGRLIYQIPKIFTRGMTSDKRCSEIMRGGPVVRECGKHNYYCVTPMDIQQNIRNIIAHAGLTGVHRGIGFIFSDGECEKCDIKGVCIADYFPINLLCELFDVGKKDEKRECSTSE